LPAGKSYRQVQAIEQLAALPVGQLARDEFKRERGRRPDAALGTDQARSGHGVVAALRESDVLPGGA
jgi:hypothetical protein